MIDVHSVPDAGSPPAVPPDQPREARPLFEQARAAFQAGDYVGAAKLFRQAYTASGKAELLYDVGSALEHAGQRAEAANAYEEYLQRGDLSHMDRMSMELRIKLLREPSPP